jgi:hypothetical protein
MRVERRERMVHRALRVRGEERVHPKTRKRAKKSGSRTGESTGAARFGVPQPDLADSFRKAMAALEDASRDIVELRRRAGKLGRGSG